MENNFIKKYKLIEGGIEYDVRECTGDGKYYLLNNEYYRELGPAIEYENGDKFWYNGTRCKSGPVIEYANGTKMYIQNKKFHRENGAAKIFYDGRKEYFLNGKCYPEIQTDEMWIEKQIELVECFACSYLYW